MGLNVCVQTLEGQYHPEWDDGRYAGDRMLFDVAKQVPRNDHIIDPGFGGANDWLWRPSDFDAFRKAVSAIETNPARWLQLADILEHDARYWIFMSI